MVLLGLSTGIFADPDLKFEFKTDLNPDLTKNCDPDWNPDFGF